jgi:signal peptidase II
VVIALLLAIVVVLLDQLIKAAILRIRGVRAPVATGARLSLTPLMNARGPVGALTLPRLAVGWIATLAACGVLLGWGQALLSPIGMAGLALAFGGATGNLVDLVRRGGVVDYVSVGWWPAFNLADAMIVCGAALCVWGVV